MPVAPGPPGPPTYTPSVPVTLADTMPAGLTPDALLEYCQTQLVGLDNEIKAQMNTQNLELSQREAVEKATDVLQSFGTTGPTGPDKTAQFQQCLDAINAAIASLPKDDPIAGQLATDASTMCDHYGWKNGHLTNAPQNSDWSGTTQTFSDLADGIKSGAEVQMLTLQDLVSQREQVVQLATGMLSKEDETLESEVKNIGN